MKGMGNCLLKRRKPPTDIDRDSTVEVNTKNDSKSSYTNNQAGQGAQDTKKLILDEDRISTKEEIQNRRILRIKRRTTKTQEPEMKLGQSKSGFQMSTALPTTSNSSQAKPTTDNSSFVKGKISTGDQKATGFYPDLSKLDKSKIEDKGGSLFGSTNSAKIAPGNNPSSFFGGNSTTGNSSSNFFSKKVEAKPSGLFNNTTEAPVKQPVEVKPPSKNLFGSNTTGQSPFGGSLFNNPKLTTPKPLSPSKREIQKVRAETQKQQQKPTSIIPPAPQKEASNSNNGVGEPQKISLFGNMNNTSSIFGNKGKETSKPTIGETSNNTSSIFGNQTGKLSSSGLNPCVGGTSTSSIFSNMKKPTSTGSIFGNLAKKSSTPKVDQEKPAPKTGSGMFSGLEVKNTGLFAGLANKGGDSSSNTGGLFGGLNSISSAKSSGLFSDLSKSANGSTNKTGENELEKEVKVSKKYDSTIEISEKKVVQEKTSEVNFKTTVKNFKVDAGGALGPGKVSIETGLSGAKQTSLIFRNSASKILHSSTIFPKISKHGYLKGKKDAVYVNTISLGEDKKPKRVVCKVAFAMGEEEAKKFIAEVQKVANKTTQ